MASETESLKDLLRTKDSEIRTLKTKLNAQASSRMEDDVGAVSRVNNKILIHRVSIGFIDLGCSNRPQSLIQNLLLVKGILLYLSLTPSHTHISYSLKRYQCTQMTTSLRYELAFQITGSTHAIRVISLARAQEEGTKDLQSPNSFVLYSMLSIKFSGCELKGRSSPTTLVLLCVITLVGHNSQVVSHICTPHTHTHIISYMFP